MADPQFKRNIAYKLRIGDILSGKPIIENERFVYLDLKGKRVVRVNIVGSIVDKYVVDEEKKYIFLTLDDASGQIKAKAFGEDVEKLKNTSDHGKTVTIIGVLRYFNDELYISPEIVKEIDPKYLVVRKLELEKEASMIPQNTEEKKDFREKMVDLIKKAEDEGGIKKEKLVSELSEVSKEEVEKEINKLLEEGTIFEPKPETIRWLG
tara:strand:+ start:1997 stop:2620 length:624 start_codon:yes stop_codon:yes gene_type:complete